MKRSILLFVLVIMLSSCGPATPTTESQAVKVYATSAAQPWLTKLYECAADSGAVLSVDADSPEIYLRVSEPDVLVSSAYQIDEEEILVVVQDENPMQNLTLTEVQGLFAQGSPSAQVWVYSSEADVQIALDQLVMKGRSVFSSAKLAVSPQHMSDMLNSDPAAIGIMPSHWKMGSVREVFSAGTAPVLAVTKSEPQEAVIGLISCLQNN